MGYTHYWYRPREIDETRYQKISADIGQIVAACERAGIAIRGPMGTGAPEITEALIAFNGDENCGHERRTLGITWPAAHAAGVNP